MQPTRQQSMHACALALIAIVLVAMQAVGQWHRVAHSVHAHAPSDELWLKVANGEHVSAERWMRSIVITKDTSLIDPMSQHQSASDCVTFDALCLGDTPPLAALAAALTPRVQAAFARVAVATVEARLPRAQARAPPLA